MHTSVAKHEDQSEVLEVVDSNMVVHMCLSEVGSMKHVQNTGAKCSRLDPECDLGPIDFEAEFEHDLLQLHECAGGPLPSHCQDQRSLSDYWTQVLEVATTCSRQEPEASKPRTKHESSHMLRCCVPQDRPRMRVHSKRQEVEDNAGGEAVFGGCFASGSGSTSRAKLCQLWILLLVVRLTPVVSMWNGATLRVFRRLCASAIA